MAHYVAINLDYGVQGLWPGYAIGLGLVLFMYALVYCSVEWSVVFAMVAEQ